MSKKKKKNFIDEEGKEIMNKKREIELALRQRRAKCHHCTPSGKRTLQMIGDQVLKCQKPTCQTVIDYREANTNFQAYRTKIHNCLKEIINACEIGKLTCAEEENSKSFDFYASLIYQLLNFPEIFDSSLQQKQETAEQRQNEDGRRTVGLGLNAVTNPIDGSDHFKKKNRSW